MSTVDATDQQMNNSFPLYASTLEQGRCDQFTKSCNVKSQKEMEVNFFP